MPDKVTNAMFARNSHDGGPHRRANSRTPRQTTVDPTTGPGEGGHELGSKHGTHFSIESEQKAHIIASVWSDWSSVLGPQL